MNIPRKPLTERITKGIARFDNADDDVPYLPINIKVGRDRVCSLPLDDAPVPDFNAMQRANAELIAEAFNVTHETGKTPRELANLVEELKDEILALHEQLAGEDL